MNNIKTALINPPGINRYIRDYYTSLIAKASYYYPPIDFVWLSASLKEPLRVFDAIAEDMSPEKLLNAIVEFEPSHIFYLLSGLSLKEDIRFIERIKGCLNVKIIAMGDICRAAPERIFSECRHIDAVLTSFAGNNVADILENYLPVKRPAPGWLFRSDTKIIKEEAGDIANKIRIGVPKWELFRLSAYRFPFALNLPVGTMLTDYGCPFRCSYCSIGTLGWQVRELDEVIDEINLLSDLGVKEIHFRDQTFGIDKDRTILIMEHLKRKKMTWSCFSRIDIVSEDMLAAMKDAGCHTIIFGIESGDYALRQKYGKGIGDDSVVRILKLCSEKKINTVGTFIIGLPGESKIEALKTIRFAQKLPLDYASFNIAVPRLGSLLRSSQEQKYRTKESINIGYELDGLDFMPKEEAVGLAAFASRKFYLRPAYILKRLLKMSSFSVLFNEVRIGYNLLIGLYPYKNRNRVERESKNNGEGVKK